MSTDGRTANISTRDRGSGNGARDDDLCARELNSENVT